METEYISRDEARQAVVYAIELYPWEYDALTKEINAIPAADVVEVVRCKECIYKDTCEYLCSHDENWFCGDGKRE